MEKATHSVAQRLCFFSFGTFGLIFFLFFDGGHVWLAFCLFVCLLCVCLSVPFPSLCKKETHVESPRVARHMLFMHAHKLDMVREAMRARPAQFQRLTMWKMISKGQRTMFVPLSTHIVSWMTRISLNWCGENMSGPPLFFFFFFCFSLMYSSRCGCACAYKWNTSLRNLPGELHGKKRKAKLQCLSVQFIRCLTSIYPLSFVFATGVLF